MDFTSCTGLLLPGKLYDSDLLSTGLLIAGLSGLDLFMGFPVKTTALSFESCLTAGRSVFLTGDRPCCPLTVLLSCAVCTPFPVFTGMGLPAFVTPFIGVNACPDCWLNLDLSPCRAFIPLFFLSFSYNCANV